MNKNLIALSIFLILCMVFLNTEDAYAQCPMCKMAAESNLKSGGSAGKGLNAGILYLLCIPYLIVTIMYFVWKKHKHRLNHLQ